MEIPLYIVDAFTNRHFTGNPAAVCPLDEWLDDSLMQSIAAENNLSETAFFVPRKKGYALRWFTPKVEVPLCGHATLATAFVLDLIQTKPESEFHFMTQSGELSVSKKEDYFYLNFPARSLTPAENEAALKQSIAACFGPTPARIVMGGPVLIAEFANEQIIRSLAPDFKAISAIECRAINITAPGDDCDFVSRFFAPKVGIDEDAVTGSAHCGLIPYWHRINGKKQMLARQVSARGGELRCRYASERVEIGGQAVLFSQGKIVL